MNDRSYACIARLLADSLDTAAKATPLPPEPALPVPPKKPSSKAIASVR